MPSATYQLNDKDLLYYLHIPKTAGMSFTDLLKAHFEPDEASFLEYIGDLVTRPPEAIARLKALSGHHFYDVDTFMHRKPVYITMLRDPVERTISYYAFIQRIPEHSAHNIVKTQTLHDFVTDKRTQHLYANTQTRYLAVDPNPVAIAKKLKTDPRQPYELFNQMQLYAPNGYFDRTMLERAQARLREFALVGLAEQFDESVELLCYTFGWPIPPAPKVLNVSPNRPKHEEIPQEVIDIIRENTQLDAELYATGKELFEAHYEQLLKDHPERLKPVAVTRADVDIAAFENKINFQMRLIDTLQEEKIALQDKLRELHAVVDRQENSFGWKFVLRMNKMRLKLIPEGSKLENIYMKLRGR